MSRGQASISGYLILETTFRWKLEDLPAPSPPWQNAQLLVRSWARAAPLEPRLHACCSPGLAASLAPVASKRVEMWLSPWEA